MRALALLLLGWSACVAFDAIEIAVDISRAGPGNDAAPLEIRVERVREADARVIVDGAVAVPRGRASSMNMSLFGGEMGTARARPWSARCAPTRVRPARLGARGVSMAPSIGRRADGPDGGPPPRPRPPPRRDEARAAACRPRWGLRGYGCAADCRRTRRPPPPVEASVIIVDDGARCTKSGSRWRAPRTAPPPHGVRAGSVRRTVEPRPRAGTVRSRRGRGDPLESRRRVRS